MHDDLQFAPGFFDLRPNSGLGALDARQLADIGVTAGADGSFHCDGRVLPTAHKPSILARFAAALSHVLPAGTPRHA